MMTKDLMRFGTPLLLALFVTGCHRDMYDQPYKRSLDYTTVFSNHASSRPIVPHTVSQEDPEVIGPTQTGESGSQLLLDLPVPITKQLLARGQERYNIYCSVCHGTDGYGDGMIVQRGFPKPPSFHSDRLRAAPAGHFFDVITRGYGVMYPYASRVDVDDRWAIAAYIRALQLSQHAPLAALPNDLQTTLNGAPAR